MKRALKWLGILAGGLGGFAALAAWLLPWAVDLDQYRPRLVQAANQRLNGRLELGRLTMTLWGRLRVQAEKAELKDPTGRTVLSVNDVVLSGSLLSFLMGEPEFEVAMDHPQVTLIRHENGRLNAFGLLRAASGEALRLPAVAARTHVGLELSHALVTYADDATGFRSEVRDLGLHVREFSLSRPLSLELSTELDAAWGKGAAIRGPLRLTANATPVVVNGLLEHFNVAGRADLGGLDLAAGTAFHKAPGLEAGISWVASISPREIQVSRLDFEIPGASVRSSGSVVNLGAATPPVVQWKAATGEMELSALTPLIPLLGELGLSGTLRLDAEADGPANQLAYQASLAAHGVAARSSTLKSGIHFDLALEIVTDELRHVLLTMTAPGGDLTFKGKLVDFSHPVGTFELSSTGLDLDQWLEWPQASSPTLARAQDADQAIQAFSALPVVAAAELRVGVDIRALTYRKVRVDELTGKLYLKDLTAGLEGGAMKLWDGRAKASFAAHLDTSPPTYTLGLLLDGVELGQAAQLEAFKNSWVGRLHLALNGSGSSFNADAARSGLQAQGSFRVDQAGFAATGLSRLAKDGLKRELLRESSGQDSKYDWIASDFKIEAGRLRMPDLATHASPRQGIDLRGATEVSLQDGSLSGGWEVTDTYGITGAHPAEGPKRFSVHAGCTCFQPCYSYTGQSRKRH